MYYSVRNLSPYTEYEMFVSAVNNIGRGPPSATVTVVTGETAGSAAGVEMDTVPHNVQVRPLSSSTIVIQWEEPDIPSGQITGYKVYYTTNPNLPVAQWRSQMVDNNQLTTISELTPHTIYTIKVQAFTYDGPGPLSLSVNVKTQQGVPSQPTNIRVLEANETALTLRWNKPTYSSEDLLSYELYWNDTYANERHTRQLLPIEKYTLLDLHPNSLYNVWIAAKSSRGEGATSPPIAARTKEYIPGEPQDLRVIFINSTALTITWKPPILNFPEYIIQGYHVFIQETNNEDTRAEQPMVFQILKPSIFEFNVTELQPDTSYAIQVAAVARGLSGNRTDPYVIKMPGGVPSKPTLFVSSMEQDSRIDVELEWSRPISTYGELLGYRIRYGIKGKPLIESFIRGQNISRYQITDLQKGEKYEFKIAGQNHIGFGQEFVSTVDMPEGLPSGPPTNVSYTFQTPDIVCFSWHAPSPKHRNGKITIFEVQFNKKSDHNNIISRNVSVSRAVFTNLDENSEYVFHVRAYTSKGAGPFGEKVLLETEDVGRAPMNVRVMATSDSSVEVWWENMPSRKRIIGYQIFYTMVAVEDLDEWQQTSVGLTESANIINLEKYAQYAVAVAARLEQGFGRLSEKITVKVKPEDVPLNLRAHDVTTHSMTLSWSPPIKLNPIHFKICFDAVKEFVDSQGITQTQIIPKVEKIVEYNLRFYTIDDLSPFTTYNVNVSAVPSDVSYRPPAKITVTTQMAAPQAMVQPDFYGVENGEEIQVILPQASEEYGPISHYFLIVVPENSALNYKNPDQFLTDSIIEQTKFENKNFPYVAAKFPQRNIPYTFHLGTGEKFGGFVNRRLEPGKKYRIFVRAVVDTPQKHLYTSSPFSEYLALNMREVPPGDPPLRPNPKVPTDTDVKVSSQRKEAGIFWIVGPLIAVITVSIFFVFIFVLRKRRQPCKTPDPSLQHKSLFPNNLKNGTVPTDPVELRRQNFQTPAMASHPPIPISEFSEHVEHLKANENMKFSQEYESIEPGQQFTWDHSNMEINKAKNRYANVIAYDHSRVTLSLENGILGTDYINANYCDGYRKPNAYIATQGPLQETFNDFWRMCWEVKTSTIVMMTKLEERTRIKCDRYWPERDSETYGSITITMTDFQQLAYYCIRTFQIARRGCSDEREVKQLQFTAWPDHGVPDHPASFLQFVKRVRNINPPGSGPIIVHCSAGVGRTGCYIVIDSMLERIKHEKSIDIYGHVTCLRAQRNYMVQTEEQYIFIHDALLEAVICGETEVPARQLHSHVQRLLALRPGESATDMLIEFRNLGYFKIDSLKIIAANLPCNKHKNRLIHILPYENTRVFLTSLPNVEGSDYINANFVDSYSCRKAYIATQEPMLETVNDFWRMLWEHNSTIIVMLTKLTEIGREKTHQYWPSDRSIRYHCLVVDPIAEYNMPQYILREFKITDARDGVFRTVRQFQFTEWPEEGVPKSGDGFIDFIGQVHKTKGQFGQDGPITVHCSAGVGRTGVFITLSIVIERMQCEGVVDMFRTVRLLRTQRPAMVQ
ncbi:tyrosine-protein phosphatase Lar, partial [Agrilus planipennis]|uniref:Tyrosine-protein phosphatase Lar n=1 Tax=Agrilus planipennis TaxID=224129 RepID=A0A7F5RDC5_AGRPL